MFKWFTKKKEEEGVSDVFQDQAAEKSPSLKSAFSLTGNSLIGQVFQRLQSRFAGQLDQEEGQEETIENLLDEDFIDDLEETLLRSDVGLTTATALTDQLRRNKGRFKRTGDVLQFLETEFASILQPFEDGNRLRFDPAKLNVYLVVGVNGAGKTTFIGKLAHRYVQDGYKVVVGAGDTFRAAAEEQVEIWAQRAGADIVKGEQHQDSAAVMFEAIQQARKTGAQVVILDTAGRLQNKFNLMEELKKIKTVIEKNLPPGAIFESLLVLDATTGQNALKQAEVFQEAAGVSGVVLTKMDSSAKGGIILTIAKEYRLPVKMVGVGEGINDLKPFDSREFTDALFRR